MSEEDDEILERAVTGDLDAESRELADVFARRPELRARFEDMTVLIEGLTGSAAEERDALERARAETTARDRAAVGAALRRGTEPEHRALVPPRLTRTLLTAAGIAVLVSAFLLVTHIGGHGGHDDVSLNATALTCVAPTGDDQDWTRFEFTAPATDSASKYQVRVYSPDGKILLKSNILSRSPWTPSNEELEKMGESIVWNVSVLNSQGQPARSSADVAAHRRRR